MTRSERSAPPTEHPNPPILAAPVPTSSAFVNPRAGRPSIRSVSVVGVGSYVPPRILTNTDLERMVDTTDEWITSRTGIRERRLAAPNETTSDMACEAARRALSAAGLTADDIDLIIVATMTPDMQFPSTACLVQEKLGAKRAAAFDVLAACSGYVYALDIASHFISSHTYETVLIIGAEKMSAFIDWSDRNTCVLFGDGAGAAVLQHRLHSHGLITTCLGADGGDAALLELPAGGSARPTSAQTVSDKLHFLRMDGRETFRKAVTAMVAAGQEALARSHLDISQIRCLIPHQANHRIMAAVAERLGARPDQIFTNVERYGNTSAASVGIGLDEAVREGRIQTGDYVLMVVFGAGLTWGSALIRW